MRLSLFKTANNAKLLEEFIRTLAKGSRFEGHTFIVGGSVRDELMGKPIKDVDMVVDLPDGGKELAHYLGEKIGKKPVIYEQFGTAALFFDGIEYEGHTFDSSDKAEFVHTRKETYRGTSRKPQTEFGTIKEDAFRRDFTINAMYKDLFTGEIRDITGKGKQDLEDKVLRTPSPAASIFQEDPLRMLRAIRFVSKLGFKPDKDLIDGLKASVSFIHNISVERVREELNNILLLDSPADAMRLMREVGLLKEILPELENLHGLKANPKYHDDDALQHSFEVLNNTPPNLLARLSGLMHDIGKSEAKEWMEDKGYYTHHGHEDVGSEMVREILKRLKYDNDTIDMVSDVVANHMWSIKDEPTEKSTARFLNKIKADIELLLSVMHADRIKSHEKQNGPGYEQHSRILNRFQEHIDTIRNRVPSTKTKPPVSGNDIMERYDLKPGREVGRLLNLALEYCYEHPDAAKEDVLQHLDTLVKKASGDRLALCTARKIEPLLMKP